MIVAGIDPSLTNTGIAVLHNGQPMLLRSIGHGTLSVRSYAHRSDRIVAECRAVMAVLADECDERNTLRAARSRIDLAVIEGPAYGACNASTHDGSGLWWGLYSTLRARRIPIVVVAPTTRAKWATGKGNADKRAILTTVRSWWPNTHIANHDQADALVLAAIGAFHHGDPMPFAIRPQHHNRLKAAQWPSVSCVKPEPPQVGTPR
ncbi:hypothetical protein HMPREF0591_4827 [Mycobacterium parascrofulaceum ATCC BAA-614]|uniref:Uncharacterized protein n=1 Tax=Mycobacterium parascrofulaceum ATCC BAA-614 TaxID=525368 RepID=D5PF83_9MYCO|nr:hypothetical protein [Mycobacterium parascrofulaceum]EFG75264.1 hypothetical protein HMPREF0591_4827 [Mycobacterium parascrofulaceum ATCC BAA-614]